MPDSLSAVQTCTGCERCECEPDLLPSQLLALQAAMGEPAAREWVVDPEVYISLLDHVPCAAFLKELAGRYVYVNPYWERAFGKTLGQVRGRTDAELWGGEWIDTVPIDGVLRKWRVTRFPVRERRGRTVLLGGFAVEYTCAEQTDCCNSLLRMILRGEPLPDLLDEICRALDRRLHNASCRIAYPPGQADSDAVGFPILSPTRGDQIATLELHGTGVSLPAVAKLAREAADLAALAIAHRELHDELNYRAHYDRLTALPNRSLFEQRLAEALSRAQSTQTRTALLWIDLDRFKEINDSLGHRFGDEILRQAAERLSRVIPGGAVLARIGGDEFAVVLPLTETSGEAERCAAAICDEFRKPFHTDGYELFTTASVGIALFPDDATTGSELQRNVDAAMYSAKARGRNMYRRYDQRLTAGSLTRLELEQSLCHALPRSEFELFYQPQVELDSTLRGMEALLRWRHPKFGLLIPRDFVKMAENIGLIVPVGAWVLREACRQAADWMRNGFPAMKVAVNVSALQFYHTDFVQTVERALQESGLPAELLELELTESVLICNLDEASRQMQRLRSVGVTIAIDDFGTGYSSLSYLQELPVDTLKIDRSFIQQIGSRKSVPVIHAISTLGHSLGLRVVAEGIETEGQLEAVRSVGVDVIQGFLFGMPMPSLKAGQHIRATVGPQR